MIDLLPDVFGVDDGDHAIQLKFAPNTLVNKKSLNHRRGIGKPGGFDHQRVELGFVFQELKQATQKIPPYGAANAAIAHLDDFLIGGDKQMMIDPDLKIG